MALNCDGIFRQDPIKIVLFITNYISHYMLKAFPSQLKRMFLYETRTFTKLFTECQSGFIPGDSCVAQLLSVTHEIYKSFDCNPPQDVRGTFFDISKAFDKVWHKGLIFKLKSYGVDGSLLKLMENYLTVRQQRVVLNGQISLCINILLEFRWGLCWDLFYS